MSFDSKAPPTDLLSQKDHLSSFLGMEVIEIALTEWKSYIFLLSDADILYALHVFLRLHVE